MHIEKVMRFRKHSAYCLINNSPNTTNDQQKYARVHITIYYGKFLLIFFFSFRFDDTYIVFLLIFSHILYTFRVTADITHNAPVITSRPKSSLVYAVFSCIRRIHEYCDNDNNNHNVTICITPLHKLSQDNRETPL